MTTKYSFIIALSAILCSAYSLNGMATTTVIVKNQSQTAVPITAWGQNAENSWPACTPHSFGMLEPGEEQTYQIEKCSTLPPPWSTITISIAGQSSQSLVDKYQCDELCWINVPTNQSTKLLIMDLGSGVQINEQSY